MSKEFKLGAIFSLVDKMTGPVQKIQKAFMACEKTINAGKAMQDFGAKVGLTGAVIGAAAAKANTVISEMKAPYMEVEESLLALSTVTTTTMGGMDKSMEMTKQKAIAWSKAHRESANQYIQTAYQMASAGLNDVQAIAATETAMRTARATMGDSADAAALIAVAYNNMGDKTKDAASEIGKFGDVISKTQQLFQIKNLNQLSEGLKYAIPTALQFGQSFEEINVAVGALNNAGLVGGQAGTAYAAAMRQMTKASSELGFSLARNAQGGIDFIGTLANINQMYGSFEQMSPKVQEAFKKAFGDEGLRTISLLASKTADMQAKMKAVQNSKGTAESSQKTLESSRAAKLEIAANRLNAIKIDFAERLMKSSEIVDKVIPKMTTLIGSIADMAAGFMDANPEAAAFAVTAVVAGAALLTILGPVVAVAGGIISTAGVFVSFVGKVGHWSVKLVAYLRDARIGEAFRNIGSHARDALSKVGSYFVRAGNAAKAFGSRVLEAGHNAWQGLMRAAMVAKQMALTMLQAGKQAALSLAQNLSRAASAANVFAGRMLLAGRNAAVAAAIGLKQATLGLLNFARQAVMTAATALPSLIASTMAWTAALLTNPVTWIVLAIVAAVALLIYYWDDLKAAGIAAWNYLSEAAGNAWNSFNEIIDGLIGSVVQFGETLWNTFAETFPGIAGFIDSMQSTFETSGAALWDAFCNGIRSVLSKPAELVQEGLQMIRNMLPFSDAKEGPLSQLTKSGRAVLATIAEGVPGSYGKLQAAVATGFEGINLAPDLRVEPNWSMEMPMSELSKFPALPGWNPDWMQGPGIMPEKPDWKMEDPLELMPSRREQQPLQAVQIQKEGRKIIIYGDIHIQTQQMNNANDFMEALRTIADSEGDGDAD